MNFNSETILLITGIFFLIFILLNHYCDSSMKENFYIAPCAKFAGVRLPGGGFQLGSDDHVEPYPLPGQTADSCKTACTNDPSCKQYVHIGDSCYMMNNKYNYNPNDPEHKGADFTSGTCGAPCKRLPGVRLPGGGFQQGGDDYVEPYPLIGSLEDCDAACMNNPNCKQYVHIGNACYMMNKQYNYDPNNSEQNMAESNSGTCN